MTQLRRYQAFT